MAESKDLPYERIETLNKIFEQDKNNKSAKIIVVTTIEAIMQKMITKKDIYQNILEFKLGKSFDLDKLKQSLIHLGYERSDIVDGKGQFSVRGGILDIGTTKTQGIRIEFWGDEVDSIRSFSITSQRTNKMLEEARIYPSHELIVTKNLEKICEEIMAKEKNEDVLDDVELIKSGNYISKIDKYFDSFYDEKCSFLDYFDENYLLCIDDIDKINARQENILKDNNQLIETLLEKQRAVPNAINNISKVNLEEKEGTAIYLYESDLLQNSKPVKFSKNVFNFKYRDLHFFKSELNILAQDIKKAIEENKNVIILSGNESGAKKVEALLEQENINYKYFEKLEDAQEKIYKNSIKSELQNKRVVISNGTLSSGFECYDLNLVVITGEDFINNNKKRERARMLLSKERK